MQIRQDAYDKCAEVVLTREDLLKAVRLLLLTEHKKALPKGFKVTIEVSQKVEVLIRD